MPENLTTPKRCSNPGLLTHDGSGSNPTFQTPWGEKFENRTKLVPVSKSVWWSHNSRSLPKWGMVCFHLKDANHSPCGPLMRHEDDLQIFGSIDLPPTLDNQKSRWPIRDYLKLVVFFPKLPVFFKQQVLPFQHCTTKYANMAVV